MVFEGAGTRNRINEITAQAKNPLFVCEARNNMLAAGAVCFNAFTPNPQYEEVLNGIALYEREKCDFLISIGGGSAIDVAKGINLVQRENPRCPHLAIPTTAGTGSEATHFAVLYKDGKKISLAHPALVPEHVILDPDFLTTLPEYHKKSTLLDALCQSIESLWAKGATEESRNFARESADIIYKAMDKYLDGGEGMSMMRGAYLSGKAINISKTTAAHAMSYGLSQQYNIAHGHAVALCLPHIWQHLLKKGTVPAVPNSNALEAFKQVLKKMALPFSVAFTQQTIELLTADVNEERLSNHPVTITKNEMAEMYRQILEGVTI
ncbi:MAG: phosphonoacetaldehyde reductase [Defluviitaleaceae bacterium]|nr:phosphonoacetaldehyde reductase [Defluviitaleaceae bacterium]MCL2274431.1 phosphonoacetaldehyde reductase [Defluviitaleaceae bacterium]